MAAYPVYGYTTSERLPVKVFLSEDVIASNRIHPWWVDVFDPNPVVLEVEDKTLNFTRLTDVTFVVPLNVADKEMFAVCVLQNSTDWQVFLLEQVHHKGSTRGYLSGNMIPANPAFYTFEAMVKKSLGIFSSAREYLLSNKPCMRIIANEFVYPDSISMAQWMGSEFLLENLIERPGYSGSMLEPVKIQKKLPLHYNWVFDAFADLHPVIFGGALRDLLWGETENDVDVFIDSVSSADLTLRLKNLRVARIQNLTESSRYGDEVTTPNFGFERKDHKYHLVCRKKSFADNFWYLNDFSVNQIISEKPGEVIASRIALWDLAYKQARLLSRADRYHSLRAHWAMRAQDLTKRGVNVIDNPFGYDTCSRLGREASAPEER